MLSSVPRFPGRATTNEREPLGRVHAVGANKDLHAALNPQSMAKKLTCDPSVFLKPCLLPVSRAAIVLREGTNNIGSTQPLNSRQSATTRVIETISVVLILRFARLRYTLRYPLLFWKKCGASLIKPVDCLPSGPPLLLLLSSRVPLWPPQFLMVLLGLLLIYSGAQSSATCSQLCASL